MTAWPSTARAEDRVVSARAALDDSAWAFAHWHTMAARAADDFGVAAPALSPRYVYGGEDGARDLIATAEPGTVSLQLEGSGWRERTPGAARILTRNAAHEVAHVFQYAVGDALEPRWLHEGFADALAYEVLDARGEAAGWGGMRRCALVMDQGPIDDAQAAGNLGAIYDCSSLAIRSVAAARGESVRAFYEAFDAAGGTDAAFLALAEEAEAGHARSVTAFLTRDWSRASPAWVIRALRAGRL